PDTTLPIFCFEKSSNREDEHQRIFDALVARDSEAAREAMQAHFQRLLESLLDVSERQAIEEARQRSNANRERYLKTAMSR
ncbi:MAG: FCD domain-containing protein, partial [Pseudomonadota bacterium]